MPDNPFITRTPAGAAPPIWSYATPQLQTWDYIVPEVPAIPQAAGSAAGLDPNAGTSGSYVTPSLPGGTSGPQIGPSVPDGNDLPNMIEWDKVNADTPLIDSEFLDPDYNPWGIDPITQIANSMEDTKMDPSLQTPGAYNPSFTGWAPNPGPNMVNLSGTNVQPVSNSQFLDPGYDPWGLTQDDFYLQKGGPSWLTNPVQAFQGGAVNGGIVADLAAHGIDLLADSAMGQVGGAVGGAIGQAISSDPVAGPVGAITGSEVGKSFTDPVTDAVKKGVGIENPTHWIAPDAGGGQYVSPLGHGSYYPVVTGSSQFWGASGSAPKAVHTPGTGKTRVFIKDPSQKSKPPKTSNTGKSSTTDDEDDDQVDPMAHARYELGRQEALNNAALTWARQNNQKSYQG